MAVENVADQLVAGAAAVGDVDRLTAVGRQHYGVVEDAVVAGASATVDLVHRDAAGVLVEDDIVADQGTLDTVHVDPGAAARAVVEDVVSADDSARDDAIATHGDVAVHVDAVGVVVVDDVAANERAIAAVQMVDAVLDRRAERLIALDQEIIAKVGEQAPALVVREDVVPDRDVVRGGDAESGPGRFLDSDILSRDIT